MSDVKKLEQVSRVQNTPWKSGSAAVFGALKKNINFSGRLSGWVRQGGGLGAVAMDLKNIKSIPGWAAQKLFFFLLLLGFEPEIFWLRNVTMNQSANVAWYTQGKKLGYKPFKTISKLFEKMPCFVF